MVLIRRNSNITVLKIIILLLTIGLLFYILFVDIGLVIFLFLFLPSYDFVDSSDLGDNFCIDVIYLIIVVIIFIVSIIQLY